MGIRSGSYRLGLVAALATALVILSPSATLAAAFDSQVTLKIESTDGIFKGKVASGADACVVGRRVRLIRIEPDGTKTEVTHTFAGEDGHYSTHIPFQGGNPFFAKVKRKVTPNGTICRKDRSQTKIA